MWSCRCSTRESPRRSATSERRRPSRGSVSGTGSITLRRSSRGGSSSGSAPPARPSIPPPRSLFNRPPLLLADEPTGNLDSQTSIEVMSIFQELNDLGLTVMLVTHESDIAEHARRIVVFKDGLLLSDRMVQKRRIARLHLAASEATG